MNDKVKLDSMIIFNADVIAPNLIQNRDSLTNKPLIEYNNKIKKIINQVSYPTSYLVEYLITELLLTKKAIAVYPNIQMTEKIKNNTPYSRIAYQRKAKIYILGEGMVFTHFFLRHNTRISKHASTRFNRQFEPVSLFKKTKGNVVTKFKAYNEIPKTLKHFKVKTCYITGIMPTSGWIII